MNTILVIPRYCRGTMPNCPYGLSRTLIRDLQIKKSSKFSCGMGILARPRLRAGRMPTPQDEEFNFWKSLNTIFRDSTIL